VVKIAHKFDFRLAINWTPVKWRPAESDRHFLQYNCFLRRPGLEITASHLTLVT